MQGNLCFEIDWASLIVGRKFTIFACFLYWRAVSKYKPLGGLYLEERSNRRFFVFQVWAAYIILEGLIHGEVYFQNFKVLGYYCYCVNPPKSVII